MKVNNLLKGKKVANKGITLIALAITIIVLLILAGVSITTLTGENGILTQAQSAKIEIGIEDEKEQIGLAWSGAIASNIGMNVTTEDLNEQFEKNKSGAIASGSNPIIVTYQKNKYLVDSKGKIEGPIVIEEMTGKWAEPYVPDGFTPTGEGTWYSGYVIEDDNTGSQFVWVPVGCTINGVTIELERIFYDDNLMTDEWIQRTSGTSTTLEQYLLAFYQGLTKEKVGDSFLEIEENLTEFKTSVAENGGYYIGRYEASYLDGKAVTKVSSDISRQSSGSELTNGMLWNYTTSQEEAKTKCEEMYAGNEKIKSELVNSYAWDTALRFIEIVEGKNVDTDSSCWGNYNSSLTNTGTTSKAVACNIYDIAGNLQEWTTEYRSIDEQMYPFVLRGGYSKVNGYAAPAGTRLVFESAMEMNSVGFRPILFK